MVEQHSILFPVLEKLRQQGVPLGASDYLLALEALQAGLGLESLEQCKQLCRLLWAKSCEDQELFDLAFAELVEAPIKAASESAQVGIDWDKVEHFKRLCQLLWAKSSEEQELFQLAFTELIELQLQAIQPSLVPEPSILPKAKSPSELIQHDEAEEADETQNAEGLVLPETQLPQQKIALHFRLVKPLSAKTKLQEQTDQFEQPHRYQLRPRLPISRRDMAEAWRNLRRPQRIGTPEELDVEGTIKHICRQGFILHPVLRPRRRNQACLVVLVDQQGSMAPFELLIRALRESIERSGLLGKTSFYYFHDCPEGFLYEKPNFTSARPLETVLEERAKSNSVLVVSDAGAANGDYDEMRVRETRGFLKTLRNYTYLYAWLNPMPRDRWQVNSAEDIACMVPMFPIDREGLNDAVNILRGHPFPPGVSLNE